MNINAIADNLGLEIEDIKELLDLYVKTTSAELKELKAALASNNAEKVHKNSHSIKGSSGNLGLTDLFELARKIDDRARENILDGIEPIVNEFSKTFEKLVHEI